jgi:hypothetical protein
VGWLEVLLGARVIQVERKMTWDKRDVEALVITVSRGEKTYIVRVEAHSHKGCVECLGDDQSDYLTMEAKEEQREELG